MVVHSQACCFNSLYGCETAAHPRVQTKHVQCHPFWSILGCPPPWPPGVCLPCACMHGGALAANSTRHPPTPRAQVQALGLHLLSAALARGWVHVARLLASSSVQPVGSALQAGARCGGPAVPRAVPASSSAHQRCACICGGGGGGGSCCCSSRSVGSSTACSSISGSSAGSLLGSDDSSAGLGAKGAAARLCGIPQQLPLVVGVCCMPSQQRQLQQKLLQQQQKQQQRQLVRPHLKVPTGRTCMMG